MTRRDTIIISVLINAGLLAILFATAWNSDDDNFADNANVRMAMAQTEQTSVSTAVGVDEVDQVLQQHAVIATTQSPVAAPQPTIAAATKSSAATKGSFVEVTVKRGDSLDKISQDNGTTIEAIAKANDLVDTRLQIGQVLRIPLDGGKTVKPAVASPQNDEFYVVQRGDSPWVIARKLGVDLQDLLRINDLDEAKARRLREGNKLKIPSSGNAVASR